MESFLETEIVSLQKVLSKTFLKIRTRHIGEGTVFCFADFNGAESRIMYCDLKRGYFLEVLKRDKVWHKPLQDNSWQLIRETCRRSIFWTTNMIEMKNRIMQIGKKGMIFMRGSHGCLCWVETMFLIGWQRRVCFSYGGWVWRFW